MNHPDLACDETEVVRVTNRNGLRIEIDRAAGAPVVIEYPGHGSECEIMYKPGLNAIYGLDGILKRITFSLVEYTDDNQKHSPCELAPEIAKAVKTLSGCRIDYRIHVNLRTEHFELYFVDLDSDVRQPNVSGSLAEWLGRKVVTHLNIGLFRSVKLQHVLDFDAEYNLLYLTTGGASDNGYIQASVPFSIDLSFLGGPRDSESIKAALTKKSEAV